jgi:tetratricopeptide (TPR) repeat protein
MAPARRVWTETLAIDGVLSIVLDVPHRSPCSAQPRRLDSLFRELAKDRPSHSPDDIENLIWALWINHPKAESTADMNAAVEAISMGAFDLARPLLDRIIERHPDWAEAWNKRATLSFIERRDAECLSDIAQTLILEPRHFGAIAGFGQICLRHGQISEAKAAFQIALAINPHLEGLREVIEELRVPPVTLH